MTWFGLGSAAWGVLLIVFVVLWLRRRRRRQRQGLEEDDGGAELGSGGGGGLFGLFGRGDYLCDECRYDYGAACTRPERPNARKCPEYRKR